MVIGSEKGKRLVATANGGAAAAAAGGGFLSTCQVAEKQLNTNMFFVQKNRFRRPPAGAATAASR